MTDIIRKAVLEAAYNDRINEVLNSINIRLAATWKPGKTIDCSDLVCLLNDEKVERLRWIVGGEGTGWTVSGTGRKFFVG